MKKTTKRFLSLILALTALFSFNTSPVTAAEQASSDCTYETTVVIRTKAKLWEIGNAYPASVTFKQTKGTYVFKDYNGKNSKPKTQYCLYDVSWTGYDKNNKVVVRGKDSIGAASQTIKLKASPFKEIRYVVKIRPHSYNVRNPRTGKWYHAYIWTKPSKWTITAKHDITSINRFQLSRQALKAK